MTSHDHERDAMARGPVDAQELAAELTDRFAAADRHGTAVRVRNLLAGGVSEAAVREAVGLAQREVGRRWQAGIWTVTQEHAATAVAETVLAVLEDQLSRDEPDTTGSADTGEAHGRVAVVAAEGEWHALPVRLTGHAFARAGLDVVYLGTGVPAVDVARTLPSLGVDALAVSVTVPANLFGAARTVAAGRAASLPVLIGGVASSPDHAAALGATAHADTVDEGAGIVLRWVTEGAPPPVNGLDLRYGPGTALRGARSRIIATANDHLESRLSQLGVATVNDGRDAPRSGLRPPAGGRPTTPAAAGDPTGSPLGQPTIGDDVDVDDQVLEDLQQLVDHLAAAVLLDDRELFDGEVRWMAEVHAGRRLPGELLQLELDALTVALDEHETARELTRSALPG
jgi:methanogenic corrinoid protein MtbC1